MSYFVGYMLEGEAAVWHRNVAKDISERFGTWRVHEKVPPHLTIFYPFDVEEVTVVLDLIDLFCTTETMPGSVSINDFDRFDDTVVFAKAEVSSGVNGAVERLQRALGEIPLTPRRGMRAWNPHATLAHKVPKETMHRIWEYVQTLPKPDFHLDFDNVTLFRHEGDRAWSVERIYKFSETGEVIP